MVSEESVEAIRKVVVHRMIERLESDYRDFIEGEEGFSDIPDFFRDHLYSPPNKEQRDAALEILYDRLKSITGPEMTENIHKLILLIQISDDLDRNTARALLEGPLKHDPTAHTTISDDDMGAAIYRAGGYEKRLQQIELICESLSFFFALSKLPLIKLVMAPIKVAANLVGAEDLVETMERGYEISRKIKDMKPFVQAFRQRETAYLQRLWGNAAS